VSGAVGAKCLHTRVLSIKSRRSSASLYFSKSSIFWPDVPRNLVLVQGQPHVEYKAMNQKKVPNN
jgi:hypothetical protein